MKVGILSLGCKVNMYESEFISNTLSNNGYEICDFNEVCDIYIINTCTVTNTSDIKSRKMIRHAVKNNPNACIVVMGCFVESSKKVDIPGVDIIIGNKDKSKIVELLDEYFKNKKQIERLYDMSKVEFEDMYINNFPGRTRAFVKIQDGCENFCTYCIIPYVRGKCRSKEMSKVLDEVKALISNGYKEIVLTGIHTGNYGVDLDTDFATLLKELVKVEGLERLRISSIEITELTPEVLDVIKKNNVIVNHMHIPLQAGSDEILKLMNRKYDLDYFKEKINLIKKIKVDISVTTDVIVGFPGESEEMFNETINTVKEIGFTKLHVFPFSLRSGTKAESLPGHLDNSIKKERSRRLLEVSKELELSYYNKFIGKEVEVLIERVKNGFSYGHTTNFIEVKIAKELKKNTLVKVKLESIDYPVMTGIINK